MDQQHPEPDGHAQDGLEQGPAAPRLPGDGPDGEYLTTNQGVRIPHTDDSLKAGERGPTLLEDFHLPREDHPLRPRAHPRARRARARARPRTATSRSTSRWPSTRRPAFLQDPPCKTPVFVRFSTVAGLARLGRHGARRARLRDQVLHRRRRLRPGRQQHPGLLHPGRDQVPGPRPRRASPSRTTRCRRRPPRTTRSGTSSR